MEGIQSMEQYFTLIREEQPVIMLFSADWCPDCRYLDIFIEEVVEQFKQHFVFYKVDRDQFPDLCDQYDILGIPSFLAYDKGSVIGRFVSKNRKTRKEVEDFLEQVIEHSKK